MTITDKIRLEHFIAFDKQKAIYERILFKKFYSALNNVSFNAIDSNNTSIIDETAIFNAYLGSYEAIFKRYAKKASMMQIKRENPNDLSISFFSTIFRNKVKSYLLQTAGERIKGVNDNTKKQIRQLIEKYKFTGARNTASIMKREIKGINKNRALLIARTESLTAMNHISYETAVSQKVTSKAWLHTIGKSAHFREEHLAINEKPIKINDKFIVNGLAMDYPGDPNGGAINNCNCRCSVIYGYDFAEKPNYTNLFTEFIASMVMGAVAGSSNG
jgi:hypothetical protein